MKKIIKGSVQELMAASNSGPFMQAQIISVTGKGKVRVTCNWLYSALNVDTNDSSVFLWEFAKIDDSHISLSPVTSCISQPIFASVRDDNNYFLQVQAPFSADWIIQVQRDETIAFKLHDLNVAELKGFNGDYFQLNASVSAHEGHSGYRIQSNGGTWNEDTQWFLKIEKSLQDHIEFIPSNYTMEAVQAQMDNCGIQLSKETLEKLVEQLNM